MSREIDEDTKEIGVGPITLDVEMARQHGWTEEQILRAWSIISSVSRMENQVCSYLMGHTRRCDACDCWTLPAPSPCHLCKRDERAAAGRAAQAHRPLIMTRATPRGDARELGCSCGWRAYVGLGIDSDDQLAAHIASERERVSFGG